MKSMRKWMISVSLAVAAMLATAGAQSQTRPVADNAQALRRFSGTPIDVDYQAANLRTVLRNLAEIGGINQLAIEA